MFFTKALATNIVRNKVELKYKDLVSYQKTGFFMFWKISYKENPNRNSSIKTMYTDYLLYIFDDIKPDGSVKSAIKQ